MRVYAETNFVLEMVLEQGESVEAGSIVRLATSESIELALPAASLFEAYETVHRRRAERRELVSRIDDELVQIGRSLSMATEASALRGTLVRASALITERYEDVRDELLRAARWIRLDRDVLDSAREMEADHGLGTPDAVMLASVLLDARENPRPSVFVTKNTRDFDTPDVRAALEAVDCEPLFKIAAAYGRAKASVRADR